MHDNWWWGSQYILSKYKKKKLLIIIPARSGSIEIKNKNLLVINNKTLINYSYEASNFINEKNKIITCSTDSNKIARICRKFGLREIIIRPKKYSLKFSLDREFVNHVLNYYFKKNLIFKYGLILRPTSPIRKKKTLQKAYKLFKKNKKYTSMRAIIRSPITPYKMWKKESHSISPIIKTKLKEPYNMPRQKLPITFWQTGNFEFFRINYKNKINSISGKKIMGYSISENESIDIDKKSDLINLKLLIKKFF
jgi:CMP-N,N'-diacetyllegionaminic acid synthase